MFFGIHRNNPLLVVLLKFTVFPFFWFLLVHCACLICSTMDQENLERAEEVVSSSQELELQPLNLPPALAEVCGYKKQKLPLFFRVGLS